MGCKVHYLNSAGIHLREIKGINALADALPAHWLLYASLTCYPKNSSPIEIDALLVTDDRVMLLELKDWNGDLEARGDRWVVNERPRGRSPVALLSEKARKVKGIISQRIPALAKVYVDLRVVLTGSCTSAKLHPDDQRYTWSLADARSLGDPAGRAALLEKTTILSVKPCSLVNEFDKVLRNPTLFRASQMNWDGYGISESDLFVHPRGLFAEHGAQQFRDPRIKALLRQWRLDKLPHDLNSPETRRIVAEREARVVGLLREAESSVIADAAILQSTVAPPDEILTDHYEVLGLPPNWTTLRRYIEKNRSSFVLDQRLDTISTLLGIAAELHRQGVAHRDLAPACIWMTSPTRLALTGFMSAKIMADESVGDWLDLLRGYSPPLPEDLDKTLAGTASERDVYQLAQIVREIVGPDEASISLALPEGLDTVLAKAGAQVPAERYGNAQLFADAVGDILSPTEPVIDHSRLDAHEVTDIPFVKWPSSGNVEQNERCATYPTRIDGRDCMVKVWAGMRRGQSQALDLAMLAMFEGITRLRLKPQDGLPHFEAAGLSSVGPFVVYRRAAGVPLGEGAIDDPARAAGIIARLGQTIDVLHGLGCTHDDLSPANILIDSGEDKDALTIIDLFDLAPPGIGAIRNHAYLPEGWERLTGQQIDRFAVVKIARAMVDEAGADRLPALGRAIGEDLDRTAIETLEPLLIAARQDLDRVNAPPVPRFVVTSPGLPDGELTPDDDTFYVRIQRLRDQRTEYRIDGLDSSLLLRMRGSLIEHCAIEAIDFDGLSYTRRGTAMALRLETADGRLDDVADLVAFLDEALPATVEPTDGERSASPTGFAAAQLWQTLIDLEEEFIPCITIGERAADTTDAVVYTYETDRPFDFDSESDVEVRTRDGARGKFIGKLDLRDLTDRTIAIRNMARPPSEGDIVSLIDRRAQASLDRRKRGVDRILSRTSEIPDLIDYFEPRMRKVPATFALAPTDEELKSYGLNAGQRAAFSTILASGPLGLMQGPPGTGKTRFIGALVHWLVTRGGASKILVASQSHEAVNGAAEELIKLFGARKDRLELLRVGAKGLTSRLRPYHSSTLRERYQRRFQGGLKARLAAAGGAMGISRALLHELVDLDRALGDLVRRIEILHDALAAPDVRPDEARRLRDRLRTAIAAFAKAAPQWVGHEIDPETSQAVLVMEEAHEALLARHARATPADLAAARRLLALSREWNETLGVGHRNFEEFLAKTRTIITGTCVGLGQTRIRLEAGSFDWVIVDEAARCTAGELAVPLQLGRRVLLVGDHLQLPPMIDRDMVKAVTEELPSVPKREVTRSDFERAFTASYGKVAGQVLDEQYRMVKPICDLVSRTFYAPHGVKLVTSKDREADERFDLPMPDLLKRPINWIDTRGAPASAENRKKGENSTWNEAEVEATMRLLNLIAAQEQFAIALAKDEEQAIGVICMYKKQKRELERRFAQQPFDPAFRRTVKIDTVDSYQGKENAIVILSLVRANGHFDPGHVRSPNRCNVAISRARERLFIIGHSLMWRDKRCRSPMRSVIDQIDRDRTGNAAVVRMDAIR